MTCVSLFLCSQKKTDHISFPILQKRHLEKSGRSLSILTKKSFGRFQLCSFQENL
jgi:hypothetical protein